MSNLGQLLRKARMERGMSLEDLQESTKIRKRYLEAIEDGNMNVLPGNFYARAFIKQYSEAVGLDPDELLKLYSSEIPSVETESAAEPIRMKRRAVAAPERSGKWASILLMIAFPLLIIGVIYYYSFNNAEPKNNVLENPPLTDQKESEQNNGASGDGTAPETVEPPAQEPTNPVEETPPPEETASNVVFVETFRAGREQADRYEVKGNGKIKVEMKVIGNECWVGIRNGNYKGDYLYQKGLRKDDTYSAEFDHNVFVNIGRANELELKINGVLIDLGTEPDPRKFQFDLAAAGSAAADTVSE
ncbi:helix-turn-helix domain-containing protein [Paenibacillus thermotolerans]|uniref:helix-turn-helix domain-containing protein n=1 Tax=Paenibacillus thermotolerans TaxID=3027807 RepID=UPI002367A9F8|nr:MULTISPECIES: RodZ domain-containing protein [unclassified Paenibacillus]